MKLGTVLKSKFASKQDAQEIIGHLYAIGRHTELRKQKEAVAKLAPQKKSFSYKKLVKPANVQALKPWTVADSIRKHNLEPVIARWYMDTLRRCDMTGSIRPKDFVAWASSEATTYERYGVAKGLGNLVQAIVNLAGLLGLPDRPNETVDQWARRSFSHALTVALKPKKTKEEEAA